MSGWAAGGNSAEASRARGMDGVFFQQIHKKQEFQETLKLEKKLTLLKKKQFTSKWLKICLKK